MIHKSYEDVLHLLDDIESEDETIDMLQKAMEYFCGNYDICEGYKYALRMTIRDQYENHADEQDPSDMDKLYKILSN